MLFCQKCGAEVSGEAIYCYKCGVKLERMHPIIESAEPSLSNEKKALPNDKGAKVSDKAKKNKTGISRSFVNLLLILALVGSSAAVFVPMFAGHEVPTNHLVGVAFWIGVTSAVWARRHGKSGWGYFTLALVVGFVALVTLDVFVGRHTGRLEVRRIENDIVYQAIAKYDPESHMLLVSALKDGVRKQETYDQLLVRISPILQKSTLRFFPKASDRSLLKFVTTQTVIMEGLQGKQSDDCYLFAIGRRSVTSMQLSTETRQMINESVAAIIESGSSSGKRVVDERKAQSLLDKVIVVLRAKHGQDVNLLDNPAAEGISKAKVCALVISMNREILGLSESEAALLLRYIRFN
jgi:hypothetical protein